MAKQLRPVFPSATTPLQKYPTIYGSNISIHFCPNLFWVEYLKGLTPPPYLDRRSSTTNSTSICQAGNVRSDELLKAKILGKVTEGQAEGLRALR